ncbi:efflux RND transporter periplasmic adaptor subunit [Litorivita pollutaquae]|uniref:Efflux RND transporter periplasmic adaptor subunit n=1 Tax=Litorivita pollutaquae TaxID=2200892 RepID=A0A2V4MUJ6_9RHOB|nr:efflux RND transporter periplasmic adaptor subunit [Litorivita pollutaquae]OUS22411.1 efflux transporter periplasmic adaptor subunit [Rhodobacterales bacterium 59_46_T64]PYC47938.1 efflux RND transporter periplasmic adaptor subunit [Litorivita pollutaquae]
MKKFIFTILSLTIIAGAYGVGFGVPEQVTQLWGGRATETAAAPQSAQDGRRGQGRATTVVLTPLEARAYTLVLRTIGSAVSLHRTEVTATDAGEVIETALRANQRVEKGDVLLRLDDRTERLALEIAEANRDQAQATVTRYEGLRSNGSSVVTDVALSEARVALRLAEANVGLAEVALDDRTIVAPISGQLGLSDVSVGDRLSSGDAIVTIDDTSSLLATFEVPERSIGLLAEGKRVLVSTPTYAGRVFEGEITAFDSRLDSVTRSATVQAEIENPEGVLLAGMTFAIRMTEDTDPLPVVPATAITWDRTGAGIWAAEDGKARRFPVTIRYREGDQVWVETDAPLGAQIVAEGASKLREGAQVTAAGARRGPGA